MAGKLTSRASSESLTGLRDGDMILRLFAGILPSLVITTVADPDLNTGLTMTFGLLATYQNKNENTVAQTSAVAVTNSTGLIDENDHPGAL